MVEVEQWAEIRRMHFVRGVSIKEIARRTGRDRNTIRRALRASRAAEVLAAGGGVEARSVQGRDPSAAEGRSRSCTGQRIRELIAPLGFDGGKTIVDDYLREVRPLFDPPRTFQRTIYRPGEICQFDLWEPAERDPGRARPDPPRLGRDRAAWATRARAPAR